MASAEVIRDLLDERILVLDGAWGTALQGAGLAAQDYRGDRFRDHPRDLTGDPDLLNLTRPDVILGLHRQYLAAGADIVTTNTFTATRIGQADYGLEAAVPEMNLQGARLARQAADEAGGRLVAGSVGPLNVTLSLSPRVDDPAFRTVSFDQVRDAYAEQMGALAEGGVDLLLIETIFDTLNAKAAIAAAREVAPDLPLWISVTIVDLSGRTLSGRTTSSRPTPPACCASSPMRAWSTSSAAAAGPPRRISSRSPARWPGCRRARCRPPGHGRGSAGWSRSRSARTPGS